MKNVNVSWDAEKVSVLNRNNNAELKSYRIVEVALDGMAWDVLDDRGDRIRFVAQEGCGCGGMKPYDNSTEYSGTLSRK